MAGARKKRAKKKTDAAKRGAAKTVAAKRAMTKRLRALLKEASSSPLPRTKRTHLGSPVVRAPLNKRYR